VGTIGLLMFLFPFILNGRLYNVLWYNDWTLNFLSVWWLFVSCVLISRIVSSGMLRRVALVRTDISEERSASFIRVTRIGELGTTLPVTTNRHTLRRNGNSSQRASIDSYS
jgi:hypothetical protein